MIAVIEGCDAAGKSTLCKRLGDYGFESIHFSQPKQDPVIEYLLPLTQDDWLAIDRFHLGERVYGPLYRGSSRLTEVGRKYVDLYLESRAAVLVLKREDQATILERFKKRGEDYLKPQDVQTVIDGFDREFESSLIINKLLNPAPKLVADRCSQRMTIWKDIKPWPQYVGRRNPKILLVGDEPGPTQLTGADLSHVPFAPLGGGCGVWLWESLSAIMPFVGAVNSKDTDLYGLWKALSYPKVVALGVKARERLEAQGVMHGSVPHPQFARRFHHKKQTQYRTLVRRAANWQQHLSFDDYLKEASPCTT